MIGRFEESLDCYYKLHAILRSSPQVMYQIADLYPLEKKRKTPMNLLNYITFQTIPLPHLWISQLINHSLESIVTIRTILIALGFHFSNNFLPSWQLLDSLSSIIKHRNFS